VKLLIDMNLSPRWVDVLRAAGLDAVHWSFLGPADAPDAEIFDYAAQNGCIVVTHDLDFGSILATTGCSKPSVVQIRADRKICRCRCPTNGRRVGGRGSPHHRSDARQT
jgi:predicted nuclease of predicted toxin-antitoxin system